MQEINSKEVAEMLGKRHDNLLRDIRKYIVSLGGSATEYFNEGNYTDHLNKTRFCYMCTFKGCELMANRMIGEKSLKFKEQYLSKFGGTPETQEQKVAPEPTEFAVDEVAKMLGLSERSVYRNIQSGKLQAYSKEVLVPVVKTMVPLEAIEQFKKSREVQ